MISFTIINNHNSQELDNFLLVFSTSISGRAQLSNQHVLYRHIIRGKEKQRNLHRLVVVRSMLIICELIVIFV